MFKSQVKIGDFYVNIGRENQIFIIQPSEANPNRINPTI
jgi:hypothetical protein